MRCQYVTNFYILSNFYKKQKERKKRVKLYTHTWKEQFC